MKDIIVTAGKNVHEELSHRYICTFVVIIYINSEKNFIGQAGLWANVGVISLFGNWQLVVIIPEWVILSYPWEKWA